MSKLGYQPQFRSCVSQRCTNHWTISLLSSSWEYLIVVVAVESRRRRDFYTHNYPFWWCFQSILLVLLTIYDQTASQELWRMTWLHWVWWDTVGIKSSVLSLKKSTKKYKGVMRNNGIGQWDREHLSWRWSKESYVFGTSITCSVERTKGHLSELFIMFSWISVEKDSVKSSN